MSFGSYRALYASALDRLFAVIGNGFYEIFEDKTSVLRGTLNTTSGRCSISENETQIIVVDGIEGWIFTLVSNSFNKITSGDFVPSNHVINIDRFFVVNEPNTGKFYWSAIGDGTSWDLSNYAVAEGSPDNVITIGKVNNEIWLFGTKSTEIWYDTGNSDSQFQRVSQGFIDNGCAAEWSVATISNNIFWLGSNSQGHGIVWMASNYVPQRISTHAIEYIIGQIAKSSRIDDAQAYCYQEEGHLFYVLTFPTGNRTLVYDLKSGLWHERGYWDSSDGKMKRHRSECQVFWKGKNYVGDYQNTNLYELDLDTYTDNGERIRRYRTSPHIRQDRKRLFHNTFELDVERGVGSSSGDGSNPKLYLKISNDGGKTFGNDIAMNIGKVGQYLIRAIVRRLGYSRDRVYRVWTDEPVKMVIVGAHADIESEGG